MKTYSYNLSMMLQKNNVTFRAHFLTDEFALHNP